MKPLVRWTIGPVHDAGFEVLQCSIKNMMRIYGDVFRYVICHNGNQLSRIENLGCLCVSQEKYLHDINVLEPCGPSWKLYPPRLSLNTHEIFIDNDLVIHDRMPSLDRFLKESIVLATNPLKRNYGNIDDFVYKETRINTGLMCLPPGFDFGFKLNEKIEKYGIKDLSGHFDEQGLVASVFQDNEFETVSLDEINICYAALTKYRFAKFGMHFVGANKGERNYWNKYKMDLLIRKFL